MVEVPITLPTEQKVDTTGLNRLLVAGFRTNDLPSLDLAGELTTSLRDLFRRRTGFEVLDVEPLPLPEQPIADALRNTSYWKRLARRFNADLIVGGTLEFSSRDESGFVEQDIISPLTGQRFRRSVWADREAFHMDLGVYFFRGSSGELIYEDHFTEENVFAGKANDDLTVLHQLFERVSEGLLAIVTPRDRIETRYLFTE